MKNKLAIFATLLLVFSCAKSTSQEETDDESIRNILTLLSNAIENDDLQSFSETNDSADNYDQSYDPDYDYSEDDDSNFEKRFYKRSQRCGYHERCQKRMGRRIVQLCGCSGGRYCRKSR